MDSGLKTVSPLGEGVEDQEKNAPVAKGFFRRMVQNGVAMIGLVLIMTLLIAAIFAPLLAPKSPLEMDLGKRLTAPCLQSLLGTDEFGRDILSRILFGARVSLYVGIISVGIGLCVGGLIGVFCGFFRGKLDLLFMRLMDMLFAFPGILLSLGIVAMLGSSLQNVMIAIGITTIPQFASVARAATLAVRERDFVTAAEALGASRLRIVSRHIVPNVAAPLIVQSTLGLSQAILSEAAMSFLGLGIQPPNPSWGGMLNSGQRFMELAPWLAIFPGVAITLTVLGFNFLGDGLRDLLDPRLRQ